MKKFIFFLVVLIFVLISFLPFEQEELVIAKLPLLENNIYAKEIISKEHPVIKNSGAIWHFLNKNIKDFEQKYGEPTRQENSLYGYEWRFYTNKEEYIQVGVAEDVIVTLYTLSSNVNIQPLKLGITYNQLTDLFTLKNEIEFDDIKFKLTEQDIKLRPIIKISDNIYGQVYMDSYTDKLAGIRFMNKDVFQLHRPYEVYYYGELKKYDEPTDEEWDILEESMEKQIFDLTNRIRENYNVSTLKWDDKAYRAAKAHSIDMLTNNYFSHYSPDGDGLQERLTKVEAMYLSAGENIAANYIDVPAVIHGWLNSNGHRQALLNSDYTHLGVGVNNLYYTQNFLKQH